MVRLLTFCAMMFGAYVLFQHVEKFHVWVSLRQDIKNERLEKEAEITRVQEELLQEAKKRDPLP